MTNLRTAAQQALEAQKALLSLVEAPSPWEWDAAKTRAAARASIVALEAALAEPVQGPDRAAFERHAKGLGYSVDPDTREGREGGYWSSHTHLMWQTWQAAMAQPVQEPVALAWSNLEGTKFVGNGEKWKHKDCVLPLYTAPPQRKPLTEEEIEAVCAPLGFAKLSPVEVARAIEAAHGIKEGT